MSDLPPNDSPNDLKRTHSEVDDDGAVKKQKTEINDDQFNDLFSDPVPGFSSNSQHQIGDLDSDQHNDGIHSLQGDITIDFDNLPTNLLEALPNSNEASAGSSLNHEAIDNVDRNPSSTLPQPTQSSTGNDNTPSAKPVVSSADSSNVPKATENSVNNAGTGTQMKSEKVEDGVGFPNQIRPINTSSVPSTTFPASSANTITKSNSALATPNSAQFGSNGQTPTPSGNVNFNNVQFPMSSNMNSTISTSQTQSNVNGESQTKEKQTDPNKLNDAIAAAGVDIQQEEELLVQQQNRRSEVSKDLKQFIKSSKPVAFLNPYHVAAFMNKIARENGVQQNFLNDGDLLDLMSASCETWLASIVSKTVMLSRHRRRGIPQVNSKTKRANANSIPRSELSKELRNLAAKQKELEEKRVSKRIALGLEKNSSDPSGDGQNGDAKAGAEETLHRAANATAAMMTMNPGRKKYSWMTSSNASAGSDSVKAGAEPDGKSKQSAIISIRGDNGLRFREIRSGNLVTMKDLLGAIEDERLGTERAIIKGYAKLKD